MLPKILKGLNTLAAVVALGLLIYSKMIFKRPRITESQERDRVLKMKPVDSDIATGTIALDPVTYAIKSTVREFTAGDRNIAQATPHFAKIGMTLVIRDESKRAMLEDIKPVLQDKLILHFQQKPLEELTNVQGRYLVRAELMKIINEMTEESFVQQIYFTQFTVH